MMPLVAAIICLVYTAEAFTPASRISLPRVSSAVSRNSFQLRASEDEDEDVVSLPTLPSQQRASPVRVEDLAPPKAAVVKDTVEEEELRSYPIDLPSPVLLSTAMVLMISSIGSLFELTAGAGGKLGFVPTAALAAAGFPLSIFLIYAAIMKGAAETEADDALYNSERRNRL